MPLGILLLLSAIGLGWLVKSFFILLGILLLTPAIGFVGFRWWLQRNLVQGKCPVCSTDLVGLNQAELSCPNCGELLKIEQGSISRLAPPGTIDVVAVDVSAQSHDD